MLHPLVVGDCHAREAAAIVGRTDFARRGRQAIPEHVRDDDEIPLRVERAACADQPLRVVVRYYLEQRDPEFEPEMAEILCVCRQVAMLRAEGEKSQGQDGGGDDSLAVVSYDEKPGIQAIGTTAPDRPPLPGTSPTETCDHEYKRYGTLTLMAGIDLLTGHIYALVKERHRSREFLEFLKLLEAATRSTLRSRSFSTTIWPKSRARPRAGWLRSPLSALPSRSRRRMDHGTTSSRASFPSWPVDTAPHPRLL